MRYLLLILPFATMLSCSPPIDADATALCDCYKKLHRVSEDDLPMMEHLADSCSTIHIEVLNKLESDPEAKEKFNAAYNYCQNEK